MSAVCEAARNVACTGARPAAVTNCLNFGNPETADVGYELAEAIEGMALACEALGLPVVSGNVSLYNEHHGRPIHPTPVVGVVGVLDDASLAVGASFRAEGDVVLIAGDGPAAIDGSVYQRVIDGTTDGRIPEPDLAGERRLHELLAAAAERRLLQSAHDVSDGGIAVAIAESAMLGRSGSDAPDPGHPFAEGDGRAVVSVRHEHWRSSRSWPATCRCAGSAPWEASGSRWQVPRSASPRRRRSTRERSRARSERIPPDVRRLRHLRPARRPRPRCRPAHLLRPLRPPAPRPGERRDRRLGRLPGDGDEGHGPREPGVRRAALSGLSGHIAIGHARYSTTGSTVWQNAQPIVRHSSHGAIALGHNGNLTNTSSLRADLRERRVRLESTSDTEVIAALIAQHPSDDLADAVADTMSHVEGAFAAVVLSERALAGFRDPDGIRPLVVGRLDDAWVLASETCALDLIGARLERELRPGELVVIDEQGARFRQAVTRNGGALCIFEFIYFARPDSLMEGQALHDVRRRMGARLADEAPADADVVIGVPDSGTPAAVGYAERSGIPYGEGLVKNRYVGRTFIQPDQGLRERGVKLKFNTLRTALDGRRVVVVDDSIVRGSTTRKLVQLLFEAGAVEVHLRISSPPIVSPCFYGIDMADQGQLIAAGRTTEEVRRAARGYVACLSLPRRAHRGHPPAGRELLPRVPYRRLPDRDPGRHAPLEAAVRGPARRSRMTDDP